MTEVQKKFINSYPTKDYMLKHKDAVKICIFFLQDWGGLSLTKSDLEFICSEFKHKCYIGSDKWEK